MMTYQPAYLDNLLARSCSSNATGASEILTRASPGVNDRNIFITIGRPLSRARAPVNSRRQKKLVFTRC
ncbi:MAG TPA: hypothetical protein VJZ91_08155, partial [Blastocatellia bacterium]|nr:hypothetical protein [Blastocatellia bacterium]